MDMSEGNEEKDVGQMDQSYPLRRSGSPLRRCRVVRNPVDGMTIVA